MTCQYGQMYTRLAMLDQKDTLVSEIKRPSGYSYKIHFAR